MKNIILLLMLISSVSLHSMPEKDHTYDVNYPVQLNTGQWVSRGRVGTVMISLDQLNQHKPLVLKALVTYCSPHPKSFHLFAMNKEVLKQYKLFDASKNRVPADVKAIVLSSVWKSGQCFILVDPVSSSPSYI